LLIEEGMPHNNQDQTLGAKLATLFQGRKSERGIGQAVPFFSATITAIFEQCPVTILDDELLKQIFACYVFGILHAYGMRNGMQPPALMGVMTTLLHTHFGYDIRAANQFTQELVNSTQRTYHPVQYSLIHRGIDGLHLWETAGSHAVIDDYLACVAHIRNTSAA
jgi:hypothetical protein